MSHRRSLLRMRPDRGVTAIRLGLGGFLVNDKNPSIARSGVWGSRRAATVGCLMMTLTGLQRYGAESPRGVLLSDRKDSKPSGAGGMIFDVDHACARSRCDDQSCTPCETGNQVSSKSRPVTRPTSSFSTAGSEFGRACRADRREASVVQRLPEPS